MAGKTYYTPFLYEGEEELAERDDSIHYIPETAGYAKGDELPEEERKLCFRKVKDENSGKKFLALFSDIETLRSIYPTTDRICLVGAGMVQGMVWETDGVTFDLKIAIGKDFMERHGFRRPEEQESPL